MSVEELLLVRGVTPALLFGPDVNRNGVIDPSEEGRDSGSGPQSGWAAYLTLFGQEHNVRATMAPRINLNNSDLEALYDEMKAASMPDEWINFIIAYRQNGPYRGRIHLLAVPRHRAPDLPVRARQGQNAILAGSRPRRREGASPRQESGMESDDAARRIIDRRFPMPLHGLYLPEVDGSLHDKCLAGDSGANQHQPGLGDDPGRHLRA